ncbi:MAG: site-2 protease family protein [Clostridia bacterium]|nr:site-2 protease family protein [Clostridia bacterium]
MFDIFTREGLIEFLYFLPALLLSLAIHEFGHAYVAYKLGDRSQKAQGRLTLSPFAHIDWFGFISIALIGIGWGKPVMVDDRNFEKRGKGNMLVALAGPMFNLGLAVVVTIILKILMVVGVFANVATNNALAIVFNILLLMIEFNVIFAVFNLIPLPPFDGSKVLYYFLPYKAKQWFDKLEQYSFWILLILFLTDWYVYIITPAYALVGWLLSLILMI